MNPLSDKLHEECAVFGASLKTPNAASVTYNGLIALQHRGQEAAGIAIGGGNDIKVVKDLGLVAEGFGGITLTYNVATRQEVDEVIELVRASGGTVVKEPQEVFWGGYHAYFADPDGYYWEVAWGPDFEYDEDGMLVF